MELRMASLNAVPGAQQTESPQSRVAVVHANGAAPGGDGDTRLGRAMAGDRKAFEALLIEARPRALAVAIKVLRNPDDAEDAVQDAFLKAWRNLARFEGRASFTTWIHRIVMNTSLDILRRQAARPGSVADESSEGEPHDPVEAINRETPERVVLRIEVRDLVHGALAVLSPAHRQAISLRELEEHSYEEIAEIAACPIGTVMSRLHHARRKLEAELRPMVETIGDEPALAA